MHLYILYHILFLLFLLQVLGASSLASEVVKQSTTEVLASSLIKKYPIFAVLEQQCGNQQAAIMCQGVIPCYQQKNALLYMVPLGNVTLDGTLDGEVGLGYRKHFIQHIMGVFGYVALKKTVCNHCIPQLMVGGECFFSLVECTLNLYLPQQKSFSIAEHDVGMTMKGFDLVGGVTLPNMPWKGWLSYSYFANRSDDAVVHGGQAKIQYHFTDWLGMSLAYGYNTLKQHDLSVGITLNNWLFYNNNAKKDATYQLTDMDKKMIQVAVRPMARKTFFVKEKQKTMAPASVNIQHALPPGGHQHVDDSISSQDKFQSFVNQFYRPLRGDVGSVSDRSGGVVNQQDEKMPLLPYGASVWNQPLVDLVKEKSEGQSFSHFEESICHLRVKSDRDRGIHSTWDHKEKIYYRDASNAHNQKTFYSSADYAIQIASLCRAAHIICDITDIKTNDFDEIMKEFMQKYANDKSYHQHNASFWLDQQKKYYHKIESELSKHLPKTNGLNGKDDIVGQMLRITEGYGGLLDPHYDVITRFKVGNETFIQKDENVFSKQLPDKQRFTQRISQPWYKNLTPLEKKLIDYFYPFLIDGEHITPHNFRSIPSVKNAYKKTVFRLNKENYEIPLGSYYHSGMLPLFTSVELDTSVAAVDVRDVEEDNWKQIKSVEPNMTFLSLNSGGDWLNGKTESYIVSRTRELVKDDSFINIPINFWRKTSSSYYNSQFIGLFDQVVQQYGLGYQKVSGFIKNKTSHKAAKSELKNKNIHSDEEKQKLRFLKEIVELKYTSQANSNHNNESPKAPSFFEIKENKNVRMSAQFIALSSVLRQKINPFGHVNSVNPVMFSCKSGKDRTGYTSWLVDADIIKLACPDIDRKKLYYNLASAGHIQYLAACNGGLPGRMGFKPVATDNPSNKFSKPLISDIINKKLFIEPARHTNCLYKKKTTIWNRFVEYCTNKFVKKTLRT